MIVVAGESLVDVVVTPDGAVTRTPGGSPFNVAVGLARLDTPALLITQLGEDEHGREALDVVHAAGCEVVAAPTRSGRTSTATALLDADGVASYEFDLDWSLPAQELPACDALHVGSLGTLVEPGRTSVLDLVEQAWARDVPVSFDPNVRPALLTDRDQAWRDIETLADRCTVVKLSAEDAVALHPEADADDIARSLLAGERTELVVLTQGAAGAVAHVEGFALETAAPPTRVVDTVGAGDAFTAAMLTVLLESSAFAGHGEGIPHDRTSLDRLLAGATEVAALTCARRGARPPARHELRSGWPEESSG